LFNKKIELVTKWFKTKPLKIKPSAKEAIEFFINQGVKVAVATGGPRDETMVKLERSGLLPFFDTVVCMEDVNMGKPNPDIYIKTANKIGLKPEDCIAFEDTEYGLLSAKRAGMICVVFPNKASEKQDLSEADLKISDFRQAIDWVKKQS